MMHGARLHVVWQGDFGGPGSIAHVNRELVRRLSARIALSISPTGCAPDAEFLPLVGRRLPRVDIVMRHSSVPTHAVPRVGRWVWMTPWEYGASLPDEWLTAMQHHASMVCANSAWTGQLFRECGLPANRVAVTHNGVDISRFDPSARPIRVDVEKRFRFLYTGRLTHRKGFEIALEAYRRAFSAADDVALVIKPCEQRGVQTSELIRRVTQPFAAPDAPALAILPTEMDAHELPGMYTACNALVHPYRGESFCLPMAEAMACGRPVIATDVGGASMFATPATATLLPSRLVHLPRLALGRRRLSNFPHWQEPAVADVATAMRRVYEYPASAGEQAVRARRAIADGFTWDHSADLLERAFEAALHVEIRPADPVTRRQRQRWLEQGDAQLRGGELDGAARAYHRCLGRHAMLGDRANRRAIAHEALVGLGRVAAERGAPRYAERFFRWASKLYSSRRVSGSAVA